MLALADGRARLEGFGLQLPIAVSGSLPVLLGEALQIRFSRLKLKMRSHARSFAEKRSNARTVLKRLSSGKRAYHIGV